MGVTTNHLLGILNSLTALLSLAMIGAGIWLAIKHRNDCMRFLQWPLFIIGVFILLISLAGLLASCCRLTCLLWLYALLMFLLMVLLIVFTIFAFVVTNKGAGNAVSGKGFREFHVGNYSSWLQKQVNKESLWSRIKSCLADSHTCSLLAKDYTTAAAFYAADLSPIQSGCCKPPSACNYTFISAIKWSSPSNAGVDSDCKAWTNDASQLCYKCNSCKAGVLQNVKKKWRVVGLVDIIVLVFFIIAYAVSCCALRNARTVKTSVDL